MANVNGDENAALWAHIAELREAVQEIHGVLDEHTAVLHEHTAVLHQHTARLDEHFQFHLAHTEGIATLIETSREHSASLAEILRRLDAG